MIKRLTAFFILLALSAGVASGAPLHSGSKECEMDASMEMMDCCERARSVGNTPEIQAARLCCAVNCQSGGGNSPASSMRVSSPQAMTPHPSSTAASLPAALPVPSAGRYLRLTSANESPPVYLLNLAFLI